MLFVCHQQVGDTRTKQFFVSGARYQPVYLGSVYEQVSSGSRYQPRWCSELPRHQPFYCLLDSKGPRASSGIQGSELTAFKYVRKAVHVSAIVVRPETVIFGFLIELCQRTRAINGGDRIQIAIIPNAKTNGKQRSCRTILKTGATRKRGRSGN